MKLVEGEPPKLNMLIAYPYFTGRGATLNVLAENKDIMRLLIDSGAFTAFMGGKAIVLDDYCKFLETIPVKPWGYFVLDVIGDPVATMANYREMLRRGFSPIPIFTRGSDPALLDEYYSTSDLVGIGGLVKTPKNRAFVNGIMEYVRRRPVHLLGFADLPFLKTYRPFSCDSSGWDNGSYGNIRLYMGNGQFTTLRREQCKVPLSLAVQHRLQHFDIDPASLTREEVWRGNKSGTKGGNWRNQPRYWTMVRSIVEFGYDTETVLNTRHFLATTGWSDAVPCTIAAWKRLMNSKRKAA